jgi:uncharacterized membrane protein
MRKGASGEQLEKFRQKRKFHAFRAYERYEKVKVVIFISVFHLFLINSIFLSWLYIRVPVCVLILSFRIAD